MEFSSFHILYEKYSNITAKMLIVIIFRLTLIAFLTCCVSRAAAGDGFQAEPLAEHGAADAALIDDAAFEGWVRFEKVDIYQSARLDLPFAFFYSLSSDKGTVTRNQNKVSAKIKIPNEADPSFEIFMPNGPLRLYLPALDITTLSRPDWRHDNCDYFILKMMNTIQWRTEFTTEMPSDVLASFLVEARCDDLPGEAVQYLISRKLGLLAFTLGELEDSGNGKETFHPIDSYFPDSDSDLGGLASEYRSEQ